MAPKRHDGKPDGAVGRSRVDPDLARRTRNDLPRQIANSGLFDLENEPAQLARLQQVFSHLPDRTVIEVAGRLRAADGAKPDGLQSFVAKFGITPAEERLLESLTAGQTVVGHAQAQGISVNTARTHMRRLLEKTGSSGQLDLIRKAHRNP